MAMCNGYKCTVILLVQYLLDFYLFMMYIYFPLSLPPHPPSGPLLPQPPLTPPYISGCDSTLTGGSRLRGGTTSVRDFGSLIKADFKHRLLRARGGGGGLSLRAAPWGRRARGALAAAARTPRSSSLPYPPPHRSRELINAHLYARFTHESITLMSSGSGLGRSLRTL